MAAGIYNITIEAYADFDRTFQIKSGASALDITGYSFAASLRERAQNTTSAADFTCSTVSNTDGKFRLQLSDSVTAGLKSGDYQYDVVMTDAGGSKSRILQGLATITAGMTR